MTEIVFILDRSGSMLGLEKDTIGGFNSMLEKQRQEPGEAVVSTVLFDNEAEVIHDRVAIADVPKLTGKEYFVRGCTALLDAVGGAIHHIGIIHKYARKEDVPQKTLFIITTDGMENASRRYTYNKVRHMIKRQKERYGWEFLFLGANIDAAAEAGRFGIDESMSANYNCDDVGTALNYEVISEAISNVRACAAPLSADWKRKIDADYRKRGGKRSMKEYHSFALKWLDKFKNPDIDYLELVDHFMADDCSWLGFEMDCGHAFAEKYGEATGNVRSLKRIIDSVDDVMLLGSAIYSQWRYFNHWAYSSGEILEPDNRMWFIVALERMAVLTEN